jgi:hypothetical protein
MASSFVFGMLREAPGTEFEHLQRECVRLAIDCIERAERRDGPNRKPAQSFFLDGFRQRRKPRAGAVALQKFARRSIGPP